MKYEVPNETDGFLISYLNYKYKFKSPKLGNYKQYRTIKYLKVFFKYVK